MSRGVLRSGAGNPGKNKSADSMEVDNDVATGDRSTQGRPVWGSVMISLSDMETPAWLRVH